jgi:hypothetical protein
MPARNNRGIVNKPNVMRTTIVMEQLIKHVSSEANTRSNRRAAFSVRAVPRGYKKTKIV